MGLYSIQNIIKENKKENTIKDIKEYSNINIIDNINVLEEQKDYYNNLSNEDKELSDTKCKIIYGKTNMEMYNTLSKNNKSINETIDIKINSKETDINILQEESNNILLNKEIINTKELIEEAKNSNDNLKILSLCMKLNSIKSNNVYENMIISKLIDDSIKYMKNNISNIFDYEENLPYFNPEEMETLGVHSQYPIYNYYGVLADNKILGENISTLDWYKDYVLASKGIITEDRNKYTALWINRLNELFNELENETEELNILKKKQSILELGWNPEIKFNLKTRLKVTENTRYKLKQKYKNTSVIDLTSFVENESDKMIMSEYANKNKDKIPIYIALTYTGTTFGKAIKLYTKDKYTHAVLALDSSLNHLYTFNAKVNGFSIEDINAYNKDGNLLLYALFVSKKSIQKLKKNLDYFISNRKNTSYSISNIIAILKNKPIKYTTDSMICSGFVDNILKSINIDLTNKDSSLVLPGDFSRVKHNKVYYKIYNGKIKNYNKTRVDNVINKLQNKMNLLKESTILNEQQCLEYISENTNNIDSLFVLENSYNNLIDDNKALIDEFIKPILSLQHINEVKEFPVQFDNEGNLLISKIEKINIDTEYFKSHKLLKIYEKNNNIEGIKYELSKLWFLTILCEKRYYSKNNKKKRKQYFVSRARLLNDFNKYLEMVTKKEKDFNFTEYYNNTPFSDAVIKVNSSTIKHSVNIVKNISTLLNL